MTATWIILSVWGYQAIATLTGAGILRATARVGCRMGRKYYSDRRACERDHGETCWGRHLNSDDLQWVVGAALWPLALPLLAAYVLAKRESSEVLRERKISQLERDLGIGGDR